MAKTLIVTMPKGVVIENTNVSEIVLNERDFSTGSRGYFVGGLKIVADGKRYQTQLQMVEIGSKPKAPKAKKNKPSSPPSST